jgi:hypothetical protein
METTTQNQTTYNTIEIQIGKTVFAVCSVSGKSNYVNVRKITSNPFLTVGKDFENFDQAIANYKNPKMKVELINFERKLTKNK